ncbi:MAG: sodium:phosphate symporter [Candidatus Nanohaloarchaea archaeon]|nr:sodium:phosphate symporter [Candidatus Nanohaloarchaea archaeon]
MRSYVRAGYGLTALFLFVLSLQVMSQATDPLVPFIRQYMDVLVHDARSALATGWLSAYIFLNGSSVAALGLALFGSGLFTSVETFLVVAGSRIGAAFIVVLIGAVEYLQGKNDDLRDSSSIGILGFLVAYLIYVPAILLGLLVARNVDMAAVNIIDGGGGFTSVLAVLDPVIAFILASMPPYIAFLLAFAGLFVSLELFDHAFAELSADRFENRYFRYLMGTPWIAMAVGALATLVTTSVAISVGLIVPLYNKGYYIKRKEIIPYLMGANITTLADTLFAAVVLDTYIGFNLVLLLGAAATLVTLVYLVFYDRFYGVVKFLFDKVVTDRRYMLFFALSLTLLPLLLFL